MVHRCERGATTAEYLGMVVIVAVIIGALATAAQGGIAPAISDGLAAAVCRITGGDCSIEVASGDRSGPDTDHHTGQDSGAGGPDGGTSNPGAAGVPGAGSGADPGGGTTPGASGAGDRLDGVLGADPIQPSAHDLERLEGASPAEVADIIAGLSDGELAWLLAEAPEFLGNLDGVPPPIRYEANREAMANAAASLEADIAALQAELDDLALGGWLPAWGWPPQTQAQQLESQIEALQAQQAQFQAWADSDRQFLFFDPAGDGLIAEVHGDLATAEHVALFVPGVSSTIDNFETGTTAHGAAIQAAASEMNPNTATIAWLGYDTPSSAFTWGATQADSAESATGPLISTFEGIAPHTPDGATTTVIGFSYGSVASSLATQNGLTVDNVVFVGSPGVREDDAGNLTAGTVWAGSAPNDPVANVPGFIHGTDPTDPSFGANVFGTGNASGHNEYFEEDGVSIENIAAIITGNHEDVTTP